MKAFIWNGDLYIRAIPGKSLFHSTMVHEVVNRGDVFALRCKDQVLTIVPGGANVDHLDLNFAQMAPTKPSKSVADRLAAIKMELTP